MPEVIAPVQIGAPALLGLAGIGESASIFEM
jgi:hypothetical protein